MLWVCADSCVLMNKFHEKRNMFYVIFGHNITHTRGTTLKHTPFHKNTKKGLPWKISLQARSRHPPYIMIQCIGGVECFAPCTAVMLCVHADTVASCVPNVMQPVQSLRTVTNPSACITAILWLLRTKQRWCCWRLQHTSCQPKRPDVQGPMSDLHLARLDGFCVRFQHQDCVTVSMCQVTHACIRTSAALAAVSCMSGGHQLSHCAARWKKQSASEMVTRGPLMSKHSSSSRSAPGM